MPITLEREDDRTYLFRITGTLEQAEFQRAQGRMASDIDGGMKPRVLTVLESFEGWQRAAEWGNLDFQYWHSNEVAKIAIVGEPRWETDALAFAGSGQRKAPVKYFPTGKAAEARAWLAEE